jgi:hypothetical protein
MLTSQVEQFLAEHPELERDFREAKRHIRKTIAARELSHSLRDWVLKSDWHFPRSLYPHRLSWLIKLEFTDLLKRRGIGISKARGIIKFLRDIPNRSGLPLQRALLARSGGIPEVRNDWWEDACAAISEHGLENEPVGRFCDSLTDVPRTMWRVSLGKYSRIRLDEFLAMRGTGGRRQRVLIEAFRRILSVAHATPIRPLPAGALMHPVVRKVDEWVASSIQASAFPTVAEVRQNLIDPLLEMVGRDVGAYESSLTAERVLLGKKLKVISLERDIPREHIRLQLIWVKRSVQLRWPEGQTLLMRLLARIADSAADVEQFRLINNAIKAFCHEHRKWTAICIVSTNRR